MSAITTLAEEIGQQIIRECRFLADDLSQDPNPDVPSYQTQILRIRDLFDQFSTAARNAPDQASLADLKETIGDCYALVNKLQQDLERVQEEPACRERMQSEPEEPLPEDTLEEDPELSEESLPPELQEDEDNKSNKTDKKKAHRQADQKTMREAAAYWRANVHPEQSITDANIRNAQLRQEEERRRQEQAMADENRRVQESLQRYNERMERSRQFEHLNSQHIDMSKEGIGHDQEREPESPSHPTEPYQNTGQAGNPQDYPQPNQINHSNPQSQTPTKAERAVTQSEERERKHQYRLKSITHCMGDIAYSIELAAKNQMTKSVTSENDALAGLAQGTYYLSTAAGVAAAVLSGNPTATLKRDARAVTSSQLAARSNDLIRRDRELRDKIALTQDKLSGKITDRSRDALRIEQLKSQGRMLKQQAQALEAKGSALSPAQRQQLIDLRSKSKQIGSHVSREVVNTTGTGAASALESKMARNARAALRKDLNAMRLESATLQGKLHLSKQQNQFRHERTLDQKLYRDLGSQGKKIPASPKKLGELSHQIIQKQSGALERKYGQMASEADKVTKHRIQALTNQGKTLKKQIQALEAKGSALTMEQRKQLLLLKKQSKEIGSQISRNVGALNGKADLAYMQTKLNRLTNRAIKRHQRINSGLSLLRGLALRPLGEDENTRGLRYGIDGLSLPISRRVIVGAGKLPLRLVKKTVQVITPKPIQNAVKHTAAEISNHLHQIKQIPANKINRVVRRGKQAARQLAKATGRAIVNATPTQIRTAAQKGLHSYHVVQNRFSKLSAGIHNRVYRTKVWFSETPIGRLISWQKRMNQRILSMLKAAAKLARTVLLWAFGIGFGLILTNAVISTVLTTIAEFSTTTILSPAESTSGKINLAPYSQIIRSEMTRFNQEIAGIMSKYEEDPAYDNVQMQYSGVANNSREMLSMMAVRMQQNLDLEQNHMVEEYLTSLYRSSHTYTVDKHEYTCSGCEEKTVQKVTVDPVTGQAVITLEKEIYCPGHTDVTITITALAFDEIFEADNFTGDAGLWNGWTEENIEWCKLIHGMDWNLLYEGVEIAQDIDFGGVTPSAHEQQIWDFLLDLTGNPYGAAGLMGNLYAESGLNPTNLQDSYEGSLGYDDQSYTNAVDSGSYQNFVNDQAGYGLAQWTYHSRKQNLLNFAKRQGTSIGSLSMQLDFLASELYGGSILADLSNATSVREASDIVMIRFENPYDQSEHARELRASYCEYYYNKMTLGVAVEGDLTQKQIEVIQIAMNSAAYGIPANPGYCQQWAAYVYAKAGLPIDGSCCAYHSGVKYGVSSDWSIIPPGAAVYGYSGTKYGHVGIYVGNGLVYHNIGGVAVDSLADWVRIYKGFAWGWEAGSDLTTYD